MKTKQKGFFLSSCWIVGANHSDHRGHRISEPAPVPYGRERGFGSVLSVPSTRRK